MIVTRPRIALIALSIAATVLLQGFFQLDGGLDAMKAHAAKGEFSNGKKLHHVYTGLPFLDGPLSWSVSFWVPVLTERAAVRLLSTTLSASLQSLGVFAMVESLRKGNRNIMLRWAPVNVFAWQYIGAAIFVPLYFLIELESHFLPEKVSDPEMAPLHAKALLPASAVTILHLYRMVYFPPQGTTSAQHQAWIAVWQLAPLWCYCVVGAISMYLTSSEKTGSPHRQGVDMQWIKATYVAFGLFSGIMHVSVMYQLTGLENPSGAFVDAFMPKLNSLWQPDTAESVFIAESAFFLQWDYIIVVVVGAIYATEILQKVYELNYGTFGGLALVLAACVASHVLSPGLVWAGALFLREDSLRVNFRGKMESQGNGKA